jgi:DNA-binding PadR family transcriptional regulator
MARKTSRTLYAILGLLSKGSASGYDLKKELEKPRYHFWNESYGQIYPMLHRLHKEGWAELEVEHQDSGPDRKIYSLTDSGRAHLERWLRQPAQDFSMRDEVALRLDLAADANTALTQGMLEREVDLCRERLENFEDLDLDELGQFEKMSTAWSKIYLEARVKWLEDSIEHLKEMSS